ncbi:GntR family transcriptional regulator [Vibrio caribbeanicus]|uniref:GntR family transcriptional regulator n=1 Tax=Vibrio caribbeanicus TaxID=701175 RepID=UPI002283E217|nr:GntR family transcriptional regulator [Vibrio caribbeanicus]MCY9843822.1 GntR family transcriptional regulator [Vibrio caribbeanicus]
MSTPTLTDKVSQLIEKDILIGKLEPGSKLVVADLKTKYQVGASPIREALVKLSWINYVTLEPQKGCWVADISSDELKEVYDGLRLISKELLRRAMRENNRGWELRVISAFHHLTRDYQKVSELDWCTQEDTQHQFYRELLSGTQAKNMRFLFNHMLNQARRYRYFAHNSGLSVLNSINDYESIIQPFIDRNIDATLEKLDLALTRNMRQIQAIIEKSGIAA